MIIMLKIILAYCCDLLFGDPYKIPHPVQIIGKLVSLLEQKLIDYPGKKILGMLANLFVLLVTFVSCIFLARLHWLVEVYLLYTCLASRSLANEGVKVFNILASGDMARARMELSYLVSRDTGEMDQDQVIRSTMETVSENTVDGIVSPLFFICLGALLEPWLPGAMLAFAMTYKAVNTMDSMWGYKNQRYKDFGYFSAKLDDWLNWLPARLTGGILLPLSAWLLKYDWKNAWVVFCRDRLNHASPNSAHPEAAVAGALGVQFGGITSYFGEIQEKPTIGDKVTDFQLVHIKQNVALMWCSSALALGLVCLILGGINGFTWG